MWELVVEISNFIIYRFLHKKYRINMINDIIKTHKGLFKLGSFKTIIKKHGYY